MTGSYIEITVTQLGVAASLILINGAISVWLKLALERRLLIASMRTIIQLILIGHVLGWVFRHDKSMWLVVAMASVMTLVAGRSAVARLHYRFPNLWFTGIISVWMSSWAMTLVAVGLIVRPTPFYQPQYVIPLLGMVLGNTLNGISLGLDRLLRELDEGQDRIEALLALGATRWEAAHSSIQEAVRTGMIPIINSMMIVGIVSLPGMMTGQLLGGVDPAQAVRYQIAIMFLIASATALGTVSAVLLGFRNLFNIRHQFLKGRLHEIP